MWERVTDCSDYQKEPAGADGGWCEGWSLWWDISIRILERKVEESNLSEKFFLFQSEGQIKVIGWKVRENKAPPVPGQCVQRTICTW